jgi:S1-C subfamily serine protease
MTDNRVFGPWNCGQIGAIRILVFGVAAILMFAQFLPPVIGQTSNTSVDSDDVGNVSEDAVAPEGKSSDETDVSLDFLNRGDNPKSLAQLRAMQDHVRDVADRVKEATVNINMGAGQGTGVIVSSDGIILTAAHVIDRPRRIALITLSDGSQAKARTLGVEAGKDSGMLKIFEVIEPDEDKIEDGESSEEDYSAGQPDSDSSETDTDEESDNEETEPEDGEPEDGEPEDGDSDDRSDGEGPGDAPGDTQDSLGDVPLKKDTQPAVDVIAEALEKDDLPFFPYLDLGVSEELNDGQWVVAVGHPGGLDEKRGMVVRVGRIINQRDTAIRTDCTLVGGDSGGPLVDMDGNLIAIHSRIGSRLQDNLHVPVDVYSDTWDMLIQGFKIGERGRLGLETSSNSAIVSKVSQQGPADKAGVEVGDIITQVDGKPVTNRKEISSALATRYPYETITLKVRRGSNEVKIDVMLGEARRRGRR